MSSDLAVSVGQYSDKGAKALNQDALGVKIPDNPLLGIKGIALTMADGISSSNVSQVASETAVLSFLEDYYCTSEAWSVKTSAERVLASINSWLHSQTMDSHNRYDKDKGFVCTLSCVVLKHQTAHIFNVGDTRIYRLTEGGLEQLTNDHRVWVSEHKSYLSRALGIEQQCAFDYQKHPLCAGDVFIIATDGIYEFITAQDIIATINTYPENFDDASRALVNQAVLKGSDDNLSVQIARIDQIGTQPESLVKDQIEQLALPPLLDERVGFDGYTVLRKIHASHRSHVYLVQDNDTGKKVVLKAPSVDLSGDANYLERFLMEEWIARRINSVHVLKADLPDRNRQYIYTVFEYIEGQTLAQWARDNPKPSLEAVRIIIEQVARGLHALHRMEMLHQDLRPENVIIDDMGTVKIIDFGSVMVAGISEAEQESGSYLLGTALYSAPEYFLGDAGTVRSDLFSLGVMSYFLLSGHYPYGTNVAKTKTQSQQRKLTYSSVLDENSEIPIWMDDALRKAVEPLPYRRYDDLFEFVHDLRKPNKAFLVKTRPPILERNPVAFWQGISAILTIIVLYLLNQ